MHHGIYIMGCIWHPFCIPQEKVGISCYFSIIRVVNSQLAWYNHVRCSPLNTPDTPELPLIHHHITITNFNYDSSFWPVLICHISVKADLGRCASRCTPTPKMYHGIYIMGCIWQPFLDSSREGGNFLLFLNN